MNLSKHANVQASNNGFTIIEVVVGVTIFMILAVGVIGAFGALARSVKVAREKTELSALASNYLEVVRNLPYSSVGTINGNPSGSLPDFTNATNVTIEGQVHKVYYEVTYIDDAADGTILAGTDAAPNDYKQVKMFVMDSAGKIVNFLTTVAPKGLEGLNNAGAILIKVFDANGQPISGANVHIENLGLAPDIILDRTTDASGNWVEVALPSSVNGYHMVVTKSGYSTDQTYPLSVGNPNPTKPDATVVTGSVTQVSFAIDLLSNLAIKTLNSICQPVSGIGLNVVGAKLIGTNPNVLKYNQNSTSSGGQVTLTNIEWDTYTPTLLTGQGYIVLGTSPVQQIDVLPNTSQTFTMILGTSSTANSLLVIVKDAATGNAIEGATVHLQKGGGTPQDYYATTGGSVWVQSSWAGGPGQAAFTDKTRYFADDGNIDVTTTPTGVRLKKISGTYVASGSLESSTFDTGGASNFTTITWQPTSQDPATTLKFQVASNTDNTTWNYKGPDGTAATYYTTSGSSINSVHDNDRYMRYKAFLSTTNTAKTPVLTSINLNYVAGCFTPGQVAFPDLTAGNNYTLDVSLAGYTTQTLPNLNISGNQIVQIQLSP